MMVRIAENTPVWLIALLQGFDYSKFHPVNFNKLLVSVGYYIKANNLLRDNEIAKIERNIDVPQELLDLFYFVNFNKIDESGEASEFRKNIYDLIKKYLED